MRLAIVANALSPTNRRLVLAARASGLDTVFLPPRVAERTLGAGDVALGRIDVLPTLDGPESGLQSLRALEERDVLVLNRAGALFAVHDKLTTALRLAAFGLPHPRTVYVGGAQDGFAFPVVVKPRFGSWGNEVTLCRDGDALARCFRRIRREVVGAVQRVAAPREWRTNVALGASRATVVPPPRACELALRAASSFGIDLAGVDLLPDGRGGWVVLELNGAVDPAPEYSLGVEDVFARIVHTLVNVSGLESARSNTPRSDALHRVHEGPAPATRRPRRRGPFACIQAPRAALLDKGERRRADADQQ